jgi:hypothetical protein
MEAWGERQVSWTDPESRARPKRPTGDVGDNVHVAVEATPPRSGAQAVTQAVTEVEPRRRMAIQAQAALGVEPPCGSIMHGHDHGALRLTGLANVRAERSRAALAYPSNRVMPILGGPTMVAARA